MSEPLLEVNHVSMRFPAGHKRFVEALRDVSLVLNRGETLGIVGESGCGKSTLARIVMGVHAPTEGSVRFDGQDLDLRHRKARVEFASKAQMVFQDPYASLDPRMTIEEIVGENLEIHTKLNRKERREKVLALLEAVGLGSEHLARYPHEFSGGQRQRIGIARALSVSPELLVCDEPTSALDVSVQGQVINLLQEFREKQNLTYLLIAHNLDVVRFLSDRIMVLFNGCVMESAPADELYANPLHPYTKLLLAATLSADPDDKRLEDDSNASRESGQTVPETGCPFAARCPEMSDSCLRERPALVEVSTGHAVACGFVGKVGVA